MKAFAYINKLGQEMIFQDTPFRYLDAVLQDERRGFLPKGLYSSQDMIDKHEEWCNTKHEEWCNTYSSGYYQVPKLEGVVVPTGTLKKLGIEFNGKPIELK